MPDQQTSLNQNTSEPTNTSSVKKPSEAQVEKAGKQSLEASKSDEKDIKNDRNTDEIDSMPDDEQATNEQTHPSSKHIENEAEEKETKIEAEDSDKGKGHLKNRLEINKEPTESGISGSGLSINNNDEDAALTELHNSRFPDLLAERTGKLADVVGSLDTIKSFNKNVPSSSETAEEVQDEDENGSANLVDESGSGDETSGVRKSSEDEGNGKETKNSENEKNDKKKGAGQAAEQERTENAEKYEDEEKEEDKSSKKPVQQKKKNLMESMLENGDLQAVSVAKGKARQKVPLNDENEEDDEEDATNVDLDFKETGLAQFSGSGDEDGLSAFILLDFWHLVVSAGLAVYRN